jgi:hypothetical protein
MIEVAIVLWGGPSDGRVLTLRACGTHNSIPDEVYVVHPHRTIEEFQRSMWQDNLPEIPTMKQLVYARTKHIDGEGNLVYRIRGERKL